MRDIVLKICSKYCGREDSKTAVRTALIYYCLHSGLYTKTVHSVQWCWSTKYCCRAGLAMNQGHRQPSRGSSLSTGLRRSVDEVRGQSS
jgi:hypothetical protein